MIPYCEDCGNWIRNGVTCDLCRDLKGLPPRSPPIYVSYRKQKVDQKKRSELINA